MGLTPYQTAVQFSGMTGLPLLISAKVDKGSILVTLHGREKGVYLNPLEPGIEDDRQGLKESVGL